MKALVELIVRELVDQPERVLVIEENDDRGLVLQVQLPAEEMGKVIGKGGRTVNALRAVVKAAGTRRDRNVWVEINRLPGEEEEEEDAESDR